MKLAPLEDVHLHFYLAVNTQFSDETQDIFLLIAEHSDSIKYNLNKQYRTI